MEFVLRCRGRGVEKFLSSIEPRDGETSVVCAYDVSSLAVPHVEDTVSRNVVRYVKALEDRAIGLGNADVACDDDVIEVRVEFEIADFLALVLRRAVRE